MFYSHYKVIMFSWISFLNLNQPFSFGQHQNNTAR
uniref:Uncharacterized protein n=1 Tax=Setaria italica TaxID=4555 RepID=K3Z1Y4_SETIT